MVNYLNVMALLIILFGIPATVAEILLSRRRTGYRKWLRIINAIATAYISGWYIADIFVGLSPGPLMLAMIRPGIVLIMVLFLSNAIANWNAWF